MTKYLLFLLLFAGATAFGEPLYSVDAAIAKGVINARASLFNPTDQKHVLDSVRDLDPGLIYATYVGVWGTIRQQDLNSAGQLAAALRQRLPRTILGGGVNESVLLSIAPQTLACGGTLGTRTFDPNGMVNHAGNQLGGTVWLDLANPTARDYYICVGTMLIDRGYTLIGFPEHENVIAHASSKPDAVRNFVSLLRTLRHYGVEKGQQVLFSGDPATDATVSEIDFYYVPSRFYHLTFAQKYQNRISRPGVGVGYSYSLSSARVRDVVSAAPRTAHVFFYVDNWDSSQDDLRRFMELDGDNRRYLLTASAQTAHKYGAYFILPLLHCVDCIPAKFVGDHCEIRPDGKTEYDAVTCGDIATLKQGLTEQRWELPEGAGQLNLSSGGRKRSFDAVRHRQVELAPRSAAQPIPWCNRSCSPRLL